MHDFITVRSPIVRYQVASFLGSSAPVAVPDSHRNGSRSTPSPKLRGSPSSQEKPRKTLLPTPGQSLMAAAVPATITSEKNEITAKVPGSRLESLVKPVDVRRNLFADPAHTKVIMNGPACSTDNLENDQTQSEGKVVKDEQMSPLVSPSPETKQNAFTCPEEQLGKVSRMSLNEEKVFDQKFVGKLEKLEAISEKFSELEALHQKLLDDEFEKRPLILDEQRHFLEKSLSLGKFVSEFDSPLAQISKISPVQGKVVEEDLAKDTEYEPPLYDTCLKLGPEERSILKYPSPPASYPSPSYESCGEGNCSGKIISTEKMQAADYVVDEVMMQPSRELFQKEMEEDHVRKHVRDLEEMVKMEEGVKADYAKDVPFEEMNDFSGDVEHDHRDGKRSIRLHFKR